MTKALALYNQYITPAITLLSAVCALAVFAYGALLLMAVAHAAGISRTHEAIRDLNGKLSAVEATYLAETKALTPDVAVADGFVKPAAVASVYTEKDTSLTFNR